MADPRTDASRPPRGRRIPTFLAALGVLAAAACVDATGPTDPQEVLDRLNALPGVTAVEIAHRHGYPRAFQLDVTQPLDHRNPTGPTFSQRA